MTVPSRHCGACGQPAGQDNHERCTRLLALDPARFCEVCGFRLDVQVFPDRVASSCRRCRRKAQNASGGR